MSLGCATSPKAQDESTKVRTGYAVTDQNEAKPSWTLGIVGDTDN
jgi:hypothetical protein